MKVNFKSVDLNELQEWLDDDGHVGQVIKEFLKSDQVFQTQDELEPIGKVYEFPLEIFGVKLSQLEANINGDIKSVVGLDVLGPGNTEPTSYFFA